MSNTKSLVTGTSGPIAAGARDGATPARQRHRQAASRRNHGIADFLTGESQPLSPELRASMQSRFAYDFSNVRIHADDRAGALADAIGANAFTVENHIVFGTAKFAPHKLEGRQLLAHELAHVVQQQPLPRDTAPPQLDRLTVGRIGDAAEREARVAAEGVMRGEEVTIRERTRNMLQADWLGAGLGALAGGALGAVAGGLIGGPIGALVGGGIGLVAGAVIGGLATGNSIFPSYREIVGDSAVQTAITGAWASTEAAANATTRREEGFWIRLNTKTGKYEFTGTVLGPSVGPGTTGSVVLGARPADTSPRTDDAVYTVASFHTHTPTAFRTVGRPIGPSDADNRVDTSDDVVGVVYDYVESPAGSGNIPAGHPIGSAARAYHSGPNRRQKV